MPLFKNFGNGAYNALTKGDIETIIKKASEDSGKPVSIAVVDMAGGLVSFFMMKGATPLSRELAIKKAYTAIQFQCDTIKLERKAESRYAYVGKLCFLAGGVLLKGIGSEDSDVAYGAVGISGRRSALEFLSDLDPKDKHIDQDHELAQIGAKHFK